MIFDGQFPMSFEDIYRAIGVAGFVIYVVSFFLLSMGRLTSDSTWFFTLNFSAACCVLVGLTVEFNLGSALIQTFYIAISLGGIARCARRAVKRHSERRRSLSASL